MTQGYAVGMTKQIAVKLPDELLGAVDELVGRGAFDSRSHAIRSGLQAVIANRRRQDLNRQYREAFARHPETAEELAEAERLSVRSIEEEPWDRWW